MTRKIGLLATVAVATTLAGCSFSVGEPRSERVADAVQQGMEERGLEVIELSFEEDSDDRNIYMGEAVVRLEGSDEEIRSSCRVVVDEEQTISESDCPDITAAMRADNLENQIIQHYRGRNIETLDVSMQGDAGGTFSGYAELRNPQTGQPLRINCTGEMTDDDNASWNCEQ